MLDLLPLLSHVFVVSTTGVIFFFLLIPLFFRSRFIIFLESVSLLADGICLDAVKHKGSKFQAVVPFFDMSTALGRHRSHVSYRTIQVSSRKICLPSDNVERPCSTNF